MEYQKDLNKEQVTGEHEEVESDIGKIRMWIIRLYIILHIKMEMRTIGLHHRFSTK